MEDILKEAEALNEKIDAKHEKLFNERQALVQARADLEGDDLEKNFNETNALHTKLDALRKASESLNNLKFRF